MLGRSDTEGAAAGEAAGAELSAKADVEAIMTINGRRRFIKW